MGNRRRYNAGVIRMTPEWASSINQANPAKGLPDGRWVPARPIPFQSIRERIRATWLVWTGKADALVWPGDQ
jgi:hypothetical protein